MTTFEDREKAFEAKFAHDAEMRFNIRARRDRLVGLWAAGLLGKSGEVAEDYAAALIVKDLQHPGDEEVLAKLAQDLIGKADQADIRERMADYLTQAEEELSDPAQ